MTEPAVYRCLDHVFSVSADRPDDDVVVRTALAPFEAPGERARTSYELRSKGESEFWLMVDHRGARVSPDPAEPLDLLFWYVGEGVVRDERHRTILHAGAVVAPDGRALLLPGPSGSGKSTTTLGLVEAGMGYLSDEFAVVDPATGRIVPFPRPLALKSGSRALLPRLDSLAVNTPTDHFTTVHVPVDRVGGQAHEGDAEPGWVVFPTFVEGGRTELVPLTPGETTIALLDSTFGLLDRPAQSLEVVAGIARTTAGFRLEVADLTEAITVLVDLTNEPHSTQHLED